MLKKSTNYINLVSILILIYLAFIPLKPNNIKADSVLQGGFFMQNSLKHVKNISDRPHYSGSHNHSRVKSYLVRKLREMKLDVVIQQTNISNKSRTFIQAENIIATIKGTDQSDDAKSLLVMSHYDSAPYSSHGASDAGAGVSVVLEGIRAFLAQNKPPKNDIIVLFTDAEEIGLLGARAFVKKSHLSGNVGAVLNFEARGTSGSSYMFMETNQGNQALLNAFNQSGVLIPNSNSLAYSVYKMLPNDTDLTVFRQEDDIVGYNFAFIDSHFNYHTQLDNLENLSLDSMAHHALYLIPMLNLLSQTDLSKLQSDNDDVYFQIPFWKTVTYTYDWTLIITVINLILFTLVLSYGLKRKKINVKNTFSGSLPLIKSLIFSALIGFAVLKFLYWLNPNHAEILQGFTYNGHIYIAFYFLLTMSLCYFFYRRVSDSHSAAELMIFPILVWIVISFIIAKSLTGAHFFIIIPFLGTIALAINLLSNKPQGSMTLLLFAPVVLIFTPLVSLLPVALGLMSLPFIGLLLTLIVSVFITCIMIDKQHLINHWVFIVPLIGLFVYSEYSAKYDENRPIPNSLYYLQDEASQSAYFFTNDGAMDDWTKNHLNTDTLNNEELNKLRNTHWRWANIAAKTESKSIPIAKIEVLKKRDYSDKSIYKLKVTPQRIINRMTLITNSDINLIKLAINNEIVHEGNELTLKKNRSIATIYQKSEASFILDIELAPGESLDFNLIEMSPDLLQSLKFDIQPRPKKFIPKPFVYSDSIITKQRVTI